MNNLPPESITEKLLQAKRVLLLTHLRPDGDALGSTFGMRAFLRSQGVAAEVLIPCAIPRRYSRMCRDFAVSLSRRELDDFDLVLALDCANEARLGCGEFTPAELREKNFICIDHHRGNSLAAGESWIMPEAASTCQMVMQLISSMELPLVPESATFLLTGMMTDTGCFCFSNTSGESLRAAALTVDAGADIEKIANDIFFSKPLTQLKFEAELIETQLRTVCNGQVAYACVTDELLEKYDFDLREDEGLIDILRGLEGVVIAMLVHHRPDGWRISLRSKDSRFPVVDIARDFGGGGHTMAAGCTIDVPEFAEVERLLLPRFEKLLAGE
ncbi:MAG: bifunctional oligoribonuclease/PAP phosphatase NrnA [Lentisphaeria bacterium]|nr:bifunctional oligoribonuclease/PAP phosphatase NrnA [Lentisphaeria bacterium]